MSRNVRITLLCEDAQHVTFAKKLLQALGWQMRDFRIERSPSGRGSAEQYVRERFPTELQALRSKGGERAYLVVMIDGDDKSVAGRRASLDAACAAVVPARRHMDLIATDFARLGSTDLVRFGPNVGWFDKSDRGVDVSGFRCPAPGWPRGRPC